MAKLRCYTCGGNHTCRQCPIEQKISGHMKEVVGTACVPTQGPDLPPEGMVSCVQQQQFAHLPPMQALGGKIARTPSMDRVPSMEHLRKKRCVVLSMKPLSVESVNNLRSL